MWESDLGKSTPPEFILENVIIRNLINKTYLVRNLTYFLGGFFE